ncbi:MAG: alpha-2-macroglobulin [Peptococcaceae bacterium]|nr:alpha-2-macroglobulin [Peptococcaceae bacterium]
MSTENLKENPVKSRKNQFRLGKGPVAFGIALAVILFTVIFWGMAEFKPKPETAQAVGLTVKAVEADKNGINPEKGFLLTCAEPLAESTLRTALKITPSFPYKLVKQAKGLEYQIIPQEPLKANTVYTIAFDPDRSEREALSWAFQTKGEFQVLASLPRPRSTYVPLNTGIEIIFSHKGFDLDQVKKYLSIWPEVEGTLEKHDKTLVFVPHGLQPATVYTVTLQKGLPLRDSTLTLAEDYSFSFETEPVSEQKTSFSFDLDPSLTEFSSTDVPTFAVYFNRSFYQQSEAAAIPAVEIALYRYPDHQAFQESLAKRNQIPDWAYFTWNDYREELNPLYKIADIQTEFLEVNDYSSCIVFPNSLEPGYYAAEFKAGDCLRQVWFQVSDLAVYLAQGEQSSLLWALDLRTNTSPAKIQVQIPSKQLAANGDESGVVLIKHNLASSSRDYALVKSDSAETLVPLQPWPEWHAQNSKAQDYWKYLYLDRGIYRPEDTIHFWGVLAPRNKGNGQSETSLSVELYGGDRFLYNGAEIAPILSQKVPVQSKVFQGQFKLPVLKPGYYYLEIKKGDNLLLSRGFEVATYEKPAYTLTLTQDKKAVFAGETINFKAQATFFEGTPLPGLQLNYFVWDQKQSVTTDQYGEVRFSYSPTSTEEDYSSYRYLSLNLSAVLPEAAEIHTSGDLYIFNSEVYLTGEAQRQKDRYTLNVKLSKVNLDKINAGEYLTEENFLQKSLPGRAIKATLYQEIWTAIETGQRYDFLKKQVVPTYQYDYSTKKIDDFTLQSSADGTASYQGTLPDEQSSYFIELEAEDEAGRKAKRRLYIAGFGNVNPDSQHYSLQQKKTATGYRPGEVAKISFLVNQQELNPGPGSILFFSGQKLIDHYQASKMSEYSFVFEQKHIPNYTVYGVYFDGRSFQETSPLIIPFAQETKELNVQVNSAKSVYRPGEEVNLQLKVTDVEGRPVPGAQVNLNLVDEAVFSLREQYVDFLSALYRDYINLWVLEYKSHRRPDLPGGAEQGGEGGVERRDFRDTVLFTTLQTDSNGQADVKFTLPDNLTSWRVTYHAFTVDLQAGSGTVQIPVSLPFFVDVTSNNNYLAGDSPVVTLRSYGTELAPNQQVEYELKLTDSQGQQIALTVQALSFESVDWQLPILEAGTYELSVAASCGELKDTVVKELKVADSYQIKTITKHELLNAGMTIAGSDQGITTLVFSDYEKSLYLAGLYRLAWADGSRVEQKLAAYQAQKLLQEYFAEEFQPGGPVLTAVDMQSSFISYQQADGGISILPYGSSDLALSAMVAMTAADLFDQGALKGYFYRLLEQQADQDRSLMLLGLAALREPVLLEIKDLLQSTELAPEVQINLALALLELGDGAQANKTYKELLALYAEDLGPVTRIKVGTNHDELLRATTQMAVLAARLDQPEKNELYRYLLENNGEEFLNLVEQVLILQTNLKYLSTSPVSFTYELNGQKVSKELKDNEIFKLSLLPEDLEDFRISQVNGQVGLVIAFDRPWQKGEPGHSEGLSISRSYIVNGQRVTTINRTDLVEIVVEYGIGEKVPSGIFELVDILPAGLAPVSRPANYSSQKHKDWDYPVEVNGQRLVFLLNKDKDQKRLKYLARVVSAGEYVCEAPVLNQINNEGIFKYGQEGKLLIK